MNEKQVQLVVEMENYHIAGHLDVAGACLHNAGSEREVFIERAVELELDEEESWQLIEKYWGLPCHIAGEA